MKKIMTNIKTLAALLMALATFAACSSDDNTIDQQPAQPAGQQVYTMTVNAQKGDDAATTRALALDNKTLNATWATSENVFVKKGDTWANGSLQPQTDGTITTLKGTLSGVTIAKDDVLTLQFPRSGELDYTGQVGTLADIAAKYDYATATVTVASVSATGNINPTEATTTFQNQQAIVKFTLIDKADGTTPLNATELTVNDGTTDYTVTPASATSEIYVAIPGISEKTVTLTATVGSDTYTYEKANVTFTNGQYYEITVKMKKEINSKDPSELTTDDVLKYVGVNGKIYDSVSDAVSDGTKACGIVAYVGSATGESYTHGLAIAMKDANSGGKCKWKTSTGTNDNTQHSTDLATQLGYKESGKTLSSDRGNSTWPAFNAALNNTISISSAESASISKEAPESSSGWFLPSIWQWNQIVNGVTKTTTAFPSSAGWTSDIDADAFNTDIPAAYRIQSSNYWSSSEYSDGLAWWYDFNRGYADSRSKTNTYYVRAVFAF